MIIIDLVEEYSQPNPNAPQRHSSVRPSWLGFSDPVYDRARQEHLARMNMARKARLAAQATRVDRLVSEDILSRSSWRAWVGRYARAIALWL